MTTEQFLDAVRRVIDEVDRSASDLTDPELLAIAADQRDDLEAQGLPVFADVAIGYDQTEADYGILPEEQLSLRQMRLLAYRTAAAILRAAYQRKVSSGTIGVSWQSALESMSTLQAGRDYLGLIEKVEGQADVMEAVERAPDAGSRAQ